MPNTIHRFVSTTNSSLLSLVRIVAQQPLAQIHVRQDHPPAAVPLQAQLVQRISLGHAIGQVRQVGFPLIAHHLATGEAAHGDDHV